MAGAAKVAVVTGAGSGIGRAVALRFAGEGWHVAMVGRRAEALTETAARSAGNAPRMTAFPCDLTDPAAVERMIGRVLDRFGHVDALVNAAGTNTTHRSLAEYSPASYANVIATNLDGAVRCTLGFLPEMRRRGTGTIVNINSEAGRTASARAGAAYVISKFGLNGFTQTLNAEERAHGIRACSIFPGDVDTPLVDRRPNPPPTEVRATFLQPDDIAQAVWFVVSLPPRAIVEELFLRQA